MYAAIPPPFQLKVGYIPSFRIFRKYFPFHLTHKKIMSRFRYVSAVNVAAPKAEEIANASICLDVDEMQAANKVMGKYVFFNDTEKLPVSAQIKTFVAAYLDKLNKDTAKVEIAFNAEKNSNTAYAVKKDGTKEFVSIWGNGFGNTLPAMEVNADSVSFGVCMQDGEIVTEMKSNPTTGKPAKYIRFFADITKAL